MRILYSSACRTCRRKHSHLFSLFILYLSLPLFCPIILGNFVFIVCRVLCYNVVINIIITLFFHHQMMVTYHVLCSTGLSPFNPIFCFADWLAWRFLFYLICLSHCASPPRSLSFSFLLRNDFSSLSSC